ncbi:hypothetical protein ACWF95_39980 [Streptomyces vinaceus]
MFHGPPEGRIGQWTVPPDLRPLTLRDELIELGDLFRSYRQCGEIDLAALARLQERKARAFAAWFETSGDTSLRREARRAALAAESTLLQHQHRTCPDTDGNGTLATRLLTTPTRWEHARSVLTYVASHTPSPDPQTRLLTLILTLRTALAGGGNVVGKDLADLNLSDPERVIGHLVDQGWLILPGTPADLLASTPQEHTRILVPSLVPRRDIPGPFAFGKAVRPKLAGWARRVISDARLRESRADAATRLLALTLATQTTADGRLGPLGQGLHLEQLTFLCPVDRDGIGKLFRQLTDARWLTDTHLTETHLSGRLTADALPLTCPLT